MGNFYVNLGSDGRHPFFGGEMENTGEPDAGLLTRLAEWLRGARAPGKGMSWIAAPRPRLVPGACVGLRGVKTKPRRHQPGSKWDFRPLLTAILTA